MPFRDTPRERKFAERSIPSAIVLKPDEFVIGIDEPADPSFLTLISELCAGHSFQNYKILPVPKSDKWKFQLANIIWHCYQECRNDRILAFDVDSVLRPTVLRGLDLVGYDGNAVVSFTKKLLIRGFGDLIRHVSYRLRVRRSLFVFSGIYWIYRPYYLQDIDLKKLKTIENGIDTYMVDQIHTTDHHKVLTLKEIGVDCLDLQNEDYPWRQFQDGIWYYTNRDKWIVSKKQNWEKKNSLLILVISKILHRNPLLMILLKSIIYCHPWFIRGWMWARQNPDHSAVRAAQDLSFNEWVLMGSKYVHNIHNWHDKGRQGTGFD